MFYSNHTSSSSNNHYQVYACPYTLLSVFFQYVCLQYFTINDYYYFLIIYLRFYYISVIKMSFPLENSYLQKRFEFLIIKQYNFMVMRYNNGV